MLLTNDPWTSDKRTTKTVQILTIFSPILNFPLLLKGKVDIYSDFCYCVFSHWEWQSFWSHQQFENDKNSFSFSRIFHVVNQLLFLMVSSGHPSFEFLPFFVSFIPSHHSLLVSNLSEEIKKSWTDFLICRWTFEWTFDNFSCFFSKCRWFGFVHVMT